MIYCHNARKESSTVNTKHGGIHTADVDSVDDSGWKQVN